MRAGIRSASFRHAHRALALGVVAATLLAGLAILGAAPQPSSAQQVEVEITHAQVCPAGVCLPGALQALVDAEPAGSAFRIRAGLYREQSVVPRDDDSFAGDPGAILSGAREVTPVLDSGGQFWTVAIPELIGRERHGVCDAGAAYDYPGQLFLGGMLLFQVDVAGPAELQPGQWHFDDVTGVGSFVDDPSGVTVEASVTPHAFSGAASGVTIRDLVVERYANRAQTGAVRGRAGSNWLVQDVEIRDNNGYGLEVGPGLRALDSHVHHNGLIGIGGTGVGSPLDVLIEGNEIAFNHNGGFSRDWERGGLKITLTEPSDPALPTLILRGNHVHDNDGPGLWTDAGVVGVLIEGNTVEDNANEGIKHEISGQATIRDNDIARTAAASTPGCGARRSSYRTAPTRRSRETR